MRKHNLAFVDLETTGLDCNKHEIIEVGCVITDLSLNIIEEFSFKVKPQKIENADPVAFKINHYNEADWEDSITIKEAMTIFVEKVRDCIMVGHNIVFDSGFLEVALSRLDMKNITYYHKYRFDTISIAWAKLNKEPKIEHFSLRELCIYFDIVNEKPHTALSDARAAYELYKKLMEL